MRNILFLLLLFGAFLYACGQKISEIDQKIITLEFNGDWERADSLLNMEISKNPQLAKYHMLKAHLYFYSRFFKAGAFSRDTSIALVKLHALKAIEVAEAGDETPDNLFYLGSSYGLLSRVQIMNAEYWNGYWSARSSRNYLEEVLDEDPGYTDAYLGLGVTEYYTDAVLGPWSYAGVWLIGLGGDRETGLEYFNKVYAEGSLFKAEAGLVLISVSRFFENDNSTAFEIAGVYREKYPNNAFVANQYGQVKFMALVDERGVEFLETEFDSLKTKHGVTNSFLLNTLGYSLVTQNRLDDALFVFQQNLRLFPDVANCYDSLAECYLTRGDNENAIKYYRLAYEKIDVDDPANAAFNERIKISIKQNLEELGAPIDN